jgi:ABC-type sugar transport system substrate-binding protein
MHVNTKGRRATAVTAAMSVGTLMLGACGSGGPAGSGAPDGMAGTVPSITAVIKGLNDPFFQTMRQGINEQARAAGVPVTVQAAGSVTGTKGQVDKADDSAGRGDKADDSDTGSKGQADKAEDSAAGSKGQAGKAEDSAAGSKGQAGKANDLAAQPSSCFVLNPASGTKMMQDLAKISAMGKTIVNIDSPIDPILAGSANVRLATYIGTDSTEVGKMAGRRMAELLPSGGKVAVIAGTAGDVTSDARAEGFRQGVGTGLKVVQTVGTNWARQAALTAATDVMRRHPDVAGFFVVNDDMGLGVARAVANARKTGQVRIISVDGSKDAIKAVKAGSLDGTVAQYPYVIGLMGVEACQAAAKGRALPFEVRAPIQMVTKENAGKALAARPKPFDAYEDPFKALAE